MTQHPSDTEMSWQQNQQPAKPKKGWFGRNWKWFLPTIILLPLLCCCGGPIGFFWWAGNQIFDMAPYKDSLTAAEQDPAVQQAIGTPIDAPDSIIALGKMQQEGGKFNVNSTGSTIDYDVSMPISGPNGTGMLVVVAQSTDGGATWVYTTQEVHVDSTGEVIDLTQPASNP